MKPFVRIQSNVDIVVTPGLQHNDVTNPDAHVPDRLKVSPSWPKATCLIRQGAGIYPSDIIEWPTVQALAKDKILTIGEQLDSADETVDQQKQELALNLEEIKPKRTSKKAASLTEIVGE